MSKRQFLIILGVWVMIYLFLGFPPEYDKTFSLIVGILIIIIAIKSKPAAVQIPADRMPYVEHKSIAKAPAATPAPSVSSTVTPASSETISSTDTTVS
jgi:hypothetical protein